MKFQDNFILEDECFVVDQLDLLVGYAKSYHHKWYDHNLSPNHLTLYKSS